MELQCRKCIVNPKKHRVIDVHNNNENIFKQLCKKGDMEMAQWLVEYQYQLSLTYPTLFTEINVLISDEDPITIICQNNDLTMAKWLIERQQNMHNEINLTRIQ